jgi:glutamate/tyrosine decarboxylase-like PLP-dependent enzyme
LDSALGWARICLLQKENNFLRLLILVKSITLDMT